MKFDLGGTNTFSPATIMTPKLGATAPTCRLTFSYRHVISAPTNTQAVLTVSLYKKSYYPLIKELASINDYTVWRNYSVHIGQLIAGYQIEISGNGTTTSTIQPYVDMEVDNTKFVDCDPTSKVTTNSSLSCDFESGTCGWNDYNMGSTNKIDWVS